MSRALRVLTYWNVLCPLALALQIGLAQGLGLSVSGGTFLDASVFVFAWAWILATPFTTGGALILNRTVRRRPAFVTNIGMLALWVLSAAALLVLPMGSMPGFGG